MPRFNRRKASIAIVPGVCSTLTTSPGASSKLALSFRLASETFKLTMKVSVLPGLRRITYT